MTIRTFGGFCLLCLLFLLVPLRASAAGDEAVYNEAAKLLTSRSFDEKEQAIRLLADNNHPQTKQLMTLLMESRLYFNKKDDGLYQIDDYETDKPAISLLNNEPVAIEKKRDFKKITLNNQLRSLVRQIQAEIGLKSPDLSRRLAAVREMLGSMDEDALALIRKAYAKEDSATVREVMQIAIAIGELPAADEARARDAVATLAGSLEPDARNALTQFAGSTDNAALKAAAEKALAEIEQRARFYGGVETLYFGLSLGSVLVLAGIGLAITFGVMGVINMAHGELIMLGAYTTYVIQQLMPNHIGLSLIVAIPCAFLVSALVGIAIERGVIRFLYGRPLETLLATFGISLVLQQAVRTIFSPLNRSVATPEWMSGLIEINPVLSLTTSRLYIIAFCLLVFFALLLVLKRTSLGLQVRAVSQNRAMARAMGVRSEWVDALTFGLGSGVAGVAGVALSQLTNVGPNLGQSYIIDSFMVVVFGGVGNLWGTLVAGLSLGVANKVLEPWAGAVLAKILVLVFIILFIQKRPRGLFPQRGRAAEG
ncbi:Urea ABC transporter, permease protein UrtB [Marinobacterium lacunae]|uniref:Urea ABC transporter, permease protein UrtB n=1 Tax=Marinobacterium lacunae TaxID=1232683 RepID=A0A081FTD7_9GAMM|nr:urea ABC transporter permease subunit UrtB [Marinobacterium lacunae]KEA61792.1 Urea ABC transporter, permease protein UrtB [Marinobacterium lacunae]MBR9884187.1 urea ABC transporter permease subunit UrtB [Oceanospirillales bacterium]